MENGKPEYWQLLENLLIESFGPIAKIRSLSRWNDFNQLNADINLSNNLLKESIHEVKDDTLLIHYTSIQSLFEILNSKKLRLFSTIHMNDPFELSFALKNIDGIDYEKINEQAKNFFVTSFCEYKSEITNRENFSMWRNYANDGAGIGIVFKLSNYNLHNRWIDSVLGKVSYDSNSISLTGIRNYFQALKKENSFQVQNLPNIIFQLACLHKASIWSEENEIRLSRLIEWDQYEWPYKRDKDDFSKEIKTTFANNSLKYFIEMDLDNHARLQKTIEGSKNLNEANTNMNLTSEKAFDIYPALTIEKIILGYRIPDDIKHDIVNASGLLAYQNLAINLQYESSIFTNYFKK